MRAAALGVVALAALLALLVAVGAECPARCHCVDGTFACEPHPDDDLSWIPGAHPDGLSFEPAPERPDAFALLAVAPELEELTLTNATWDRPPTLTPFSGLRRLTLADGRLADLGSDAWTGVPAALRRLDLERNRVERVGPDSLTRFRGLEALRLSWNRVSVLEPPAFGALLRLRELRLDGNRIERLPKDAFGDLSALRTLDLKRNRITDVHEFAFRNLTSLQELSLRRNRIERLKDGTFHTLKNLRSLHLDGNRIETVSKRWTFGLGALVTLTLSKNRLSSVEPDCWDWGEALERLDLSGNALRSLDARTFQRLPSLLRLDLSGNRIAAVGEGSFSHLPALRELDLSSNELSWTVEDMREPFAGPRALETLSLRDNRIGSVGDGALRGLGALARLDLTGNALTSLRERAFEQTPSLRELRFDSTDLLCDCGLAWLASRPFAAAGANATCVYPPALEGRRALSVPADEFPCDDSPKPVVLEHPTSRAVARGDSATLRCSASSRVDSETTFRWTKDNADVPAFVARLETPGETDSSRSSELRLADASDSDSGRYQCVASNRYGTTYSRRAAVSVVVPPKFESAPENVTVRAGETAKLVCAASGRPAPQISWKKDDGDDFPAARERRMQVYPDDDSFFIINAKAADVGVYACNATNAAGWVVSNATLSVLEPPSLAGAAEPKDVPAGESIVVECMSSGSPRPTLTWRKDGAPIALTERHFFTAEDQLLIVVNAGPADAGSYECEAENELGRATGSSVVRVIPPSSGEEDTTGVIVITVVCCAVATSVVWVVIIYQTRKRLERAAERPFQDSLRLAPLPVDRATLDDVSERSSCKDSGTGDSAKRSSTEALPTENGHASGPGVPVSVYVNPAHEIRGPFSSRDRREHVTVQMHRFDHDDDDDVEGNFPYS